MRSNVAGVALPPRSARTALAPGPRAGCESFPNRGPHFHGRLLMHARYCLAILAAARTSWAIPAPPAARGADILFIGDGSDNTVKRFHSVTGRPLDAPGQPFIAGLSGPRGLLVRGGRLLVVNQNVNDKLPGEVRLYDGQTG